MPSEKRARQRAYREIKLAEKQKRTRRNRMVRRAIGALVVVGIVIGIIAAVSSSPKPKPAATKHVTTTTVAPPTTLPAATKAIAPSCPPVTAAGASTRVIHFTKAPPTCISPTGVYLATVRTTAGSFVVTMHASASLAAVNNFVFLARYHYFDGTVFHRVIPGFLDQGGDPTGTGKGGPGYSFTGNTPPASCNAKHDCYPLGGVAMANSGADPKTNGSQFFIVTGTEGEQLPPSYTLFGQVTSGMAVVQKINAGGTSLGTPAVRYYVSKVTIAESS